MVFKHNFIRCTPVDYIGLDLIKLTLYVRYQTFRLKFQNNMI